MKKLSFFLMAMLISVMSLAETYSYTFTKNVLNTSGGTVALGDVTWSYPAVGYTGLDSNGKGQQFGSGSKPAKDFTLSAIIPGEIQSVTVNAATASSATAYLKVTVGDTEFINSKLTTSSADYTGTGAASGEIKINFTQTSSKALYIKAITVVYNPNAGGPVKESVTLTWSAATVDAILGEEAELPTLSTTPADLAGVTYSSTNTAVATINATTGAVTLVGGGTTDIVASFAETDDYYAAEAKYTLTVLATTEDTWNLVTDASTLKVGDEVIIAAAESDVAMSTTQNSNNRGVAVVVKNENIVKATNQVQVFTLEAGEGEGTFAFNTGSGYIYAASSGSNHLKTEDAISVNSSWTITIAEGVTSVVATNSTNRNVMQYNESSQLFSCYSSASQKPLALYKKYIEPELAVMDIEMTNLVVEEMEGFLVLTASDDDNTGLNVMLALNADGTLNTEVSYMALIQGWNETELPIVEGAITKTYNEELATDVYTGLIVVEYMEGKLGLNLTMYAKPVVVTDVVVTDATITVETGDDGMGGTYEMINVTANWNESVLKLEGVEKEFNGFLQITETFVVDGEEDWYIWMCMNGVITTVDNVLTVTGEFKNNYTGDVYNVTISGKLPVVKPTTITYELNGGVLPAPAVPTNAELWGTDTADVNGFMHYFNHYHNLARAAQDINAAGNPVATFLTGMPDDAGVFVDAESDFKWLGDYILKVTNDQITAGTLTILKAIDTNIKWRYSVQAFFMCLPATDSNYKGWADFTEAGKPENWGPYYQAANALVLPTEPVAEDYTLPTPTKEGYTFVGWYDNAEGTGEAYKVIPAGWAGTLYAIWKANGPTTDLDNIAVEGKAVKAIINGQVLIMIGDKTFNMMGQQVK